MKLSLVPKVMLATAMLSNPVMAVNNQEINYNAYRSSYDAKTHVLSCKDGRKFDHGFYKDGLSNVIVSYPEGGKVLPVSKDIQELVYKILTGAKNSQIVSPAGVSKMTRQSLQGEVYSEDSLNGDVVFVIDDIRYSVYVWNHDACEYDFSKRSEYAGNVKKIEAKQAEQSFIRINARPNGTRSRKDLTSFQDDGLNGIVNDYASPQHRVESDYFHPEPGSEFAKQVNADFAKAVRILLNSYKK